MDLSDTSKLLDSMSGNRSNYEFTHIVVEQYGGVHRQLKQLLLEKERCLAAIQEKTATIELMLYRATQIEDKTVQQLVQTINDAQSVTIRREITDLTRDVAQIDKWLSTYTSKDLESIAASFEQDEPEHWAVRIGRQGAIEILADDKVSNATMQQMTMLPLNDYKRAVQVTSQYADFIKATTEKAERQMLPPQIKSTVSKDAAIPSAKSVPTYAKQ